MSWDRLRLWLRSAAPPLYPLTPLHPADSQALAGLCCDVCRGPVGPGYARCYQCGQHDLFGHGLLADAVVPVSYAVKGTAFADDLWRYKSNLAPDLSIRRARASILALSLIHISEPTRP